MKRSIFLLVMLAACCFSCSGGDNLPAQEQTGQVQQASFNLCPSKLFYQEAYEMSIGPTEFGCTTNFGNFIPVYSSEYICAFQGMQGPLAGNEGVSLDIDYRGNYTWQTSVYGTPGIRHAYFGCVAISSLQSYDNGPWYTDSVYELVAGAGHSGTNTIWTDSGNQHTICPISGLGGPTGNGDDVSMVRPSGNSWLMTTGSDIHNGAWQRATSARCFTFTAPLTLTQQYVVNQGTHQVQTNPGKGLCWLSELLGGMGGLNSGAYINSSGALVNQSGGGAYPTAGARCLYQ